MAFSEKKKMTGDGEHGGDIDLKPFINFLVVLIPVLMLSAEFAKISIINLKLPEGRGSQTVSAQKTPSEEDESAKLLLTMIVTDSVVTIAAKGGFLPAMFYKEFHKYVSAQDRSNDTIFEFDPRNPKKEVINKLTGKPFAVNERQEILLYVTDENFRIVKCLYEKKTNQMVSSSSFDTISLAKIGDTVNVFDEESGERKSIIVTDPGVFELRPLNAYDEMRNRLLVIKQRFRDAEDANDIIIAAENQVAYDKIIQLMDIARAAEFPNISISKLRG
jgi:biopolymer transport protein ExbD